MRVQPRCMLTSRCRAMPFSASALKKNCLTFILWWKTNGNVYHRALYSYRRRKRVITLFPNIFFSLFLPVERVCKSFWRKVWGGQVAHLHNSAHAPSLFRAKISLEFKWFLSYIQHNFHILLLKSVIPNFVACLVILGMAFSFIKLIVSSGTSTKRETAAIITSAEVIITE